ncbi:MAG TPA: DUF4342 domain-containing protein, partial [Anaerolineae bacterium]|nr:DUF4342 domain-containing protein [Anaerolineae bacterium]
LYKTECAGTRKYAMSKLSELIEEGKRHRVSLKNQKGKTLINISLLLALILVIAAPQLLLAVLIGIALEIIDVEYDGQELDWDGLG